MGFVYLLSGTFIIVFWGLCTQLSPLKQNQWAESTLNTMDAFGFEYQANPICVVFDVGSVTNSRVKSNASMRPSLYCYGRPGASSRHKRYSNCLAKLE